MSGTANASPSNADLQVVKLYESFVGKERMRKMTAQFDKSSFSDDTATSPGMVKQVADKLPNPFNPCFCSNEVVDGVSDVAKNLAHVATHPFDTCFGSTNSLSTTGKSREWSQVMTSVSTGVLGTGIFLSSVSATYGEIKGSDDVSVLNQGFNKALEPIYITGKSRARAGNPLCRTVEFDTVPVEGDYWIVYISNDLSTVIVSAPILLKTPLFAAMVKPNFGMYVLTKDRDAFWNDRGLVAETRTALKDLGFDSWYNTAVVSGESFEYTAADKKRATVSNDRVRV
jgi:hypothetical protein